jgi:integrase/recombinase XerD
MNRECNVLKRVKTPQGWRFCRVVMSKNGAVKPDAVMVDGKEERHPEGAYYIDWREGNKRFRERVANAQDANARRLRKEADLKAESLGSKIVKEKQGGPSLASAITDYLDETKLTKKPKTLAAYRTALSYFAESCKAKTVADVTRKDLLVFSAFLRDDKEQAPRSCWNKFANVMSFLKAQGVRGLMSKNDWPRFTETEPEIYEREELGKLFAACDAEEKLWFEFFLMTGFREQEVMYCTWSDVNTSRCTVTVRHKPEYNWTPKAYKEREVPIPAKLCATLKTRKAKAGDCALVFPTSGCRPKLNFLDCLKVVAQRAKLDPDNFYLHKFRATFATWSLWHPVDLRTVQQWLGHSDMESTMRYLKPSRSQATHATVNTIFA